MIQYPISSSALRARIRRVKPNWLSRAAARTDWLKSQGMWVKERGTGPEVPEWGEIKPVYRKLQGHKCAYCERLLPAEAAHTREHDLEHFRPKGASDPWGGDTLAPPTKPGPAGGYYWLAYEPTNYCTSCKTCNQDQKRARFPIDGIPGSSPNRVSTLNRKEKLILLYPIGDLDDDPATHITFIGHLPAIVETAGIPSRRGEGNISFYRLDSRDELLQGRASQVLLVHSLLIEAAAGDQDSAALADSMQKPTWQFCGAIRAHVILWNSDRAAADVVASGLRRYLASIH